jgi:uncharacterized SAM-dependent methyltransferase
VGASPRYLRGGARGLLRRVERILRRGQPVRGSHQDGLALEPEPRARRAVLVLFLGSSIGNLSATTRPFLADLRSFLRPGDACCSAPTSWPEAQLLAASTTRSGSPRPSTATRSRA